VLQKCNFAKLRYAPAVQQRRLGTCQYEEYQFLIFNLLLQLQNPFTVFKLLLLITILHFSKMKIQRRLLKLQQFVLVRVFQHSLSDSRLHDYKKSTKYRPVAPKSLTSWSWALLEKPPIVQPLKNFPAFYGTHRFITVFTRALHWSLSWDSSIQPIPPHPKINFNIIHPPTSWSS
jgi:hypothetical protein